jgi:hypothetical protein
MPDGFATVHRAPIERLGVKFPGSTRQELRVQFWIKPPGEMRSWTRCASPACRSSVIKGAGCRPWVDAVEKGLSYWMDGSTCAAPHPKPRNGTRCRHKRPVLAIVETVSGHRKRKLKKTGAEIIRACCPEHG